MGVNLVVQKSLNWEFALRQLPQGTMVKTTAKMLDATAGKLQGHLCKGKVQGTYASKLRDCVMCDFYKKVKKEEGDNFIA